MAAFAVLTLTALPLRAEVFQTLELMRQEALTREGVVSAVIDVADRSLKVTMADGSDMTVSPDNLDLVLNGIESEADRKAEVAHFMAQIDRAGCFAYSPVSGAAANDLPGTMPTSFLSIMAALSPATLL